MSLPKNHLSPSEALLLLLSLPIFLLFIEFSLSSPCQYGHDGSECQFPVCWNHSAPEITPATLNPVNWNILTIAATGSFLKLYVYGPFDVVAPVWFNGARIRYSLNPEVVGLCLYRVLGGDTFSKVSGSDVEIQVTNSGSATEVSAFLDDPNGMELISGVYAIGIIYQSSARVYRKYALGGAWYRGSLSGRSSSRDFPPNLVKNQFDSWTSGYSPMAVTYEAFEVPGTGGCGEPSNGTCVGPDECECEVGLYTGDRCEFPICYGLSSDSACSFPNGSCAGPNNCWCEDEFIGDNCETVLCYQKPNPSDDGEAEEEGAAFACSYPNGTCIGPNQCLCVPGFVGEECDDWVCDGETSGSASACSGVNGTCIGPGKCLCEVGFRGESCQFPVCYGKSAEQESEEVCSYPNGTCLGPGNCMCEHGYTGNECEFVVCFGKTTEDPVGSGTCSSPNGTCVAPDDCLCHSGYAGNECEFINCYSKTTEDPSASETCSFPNGTCMSPGQCLCEPGYYGDECEFLVCYSKTTEDPVGSGTCSSPNGTCVSPDSCACFEGYAGPECEFLICFDRTTEDPSTSATCAYPNGSCVSPDHCLCAEGYGGTECEFPICFGNATSSVCGPHGTCSAPGICSCFPRFSGGACTECEPGYQGEDCSSWYSCYGLRGNYPLEDGTCSYPNGSCAETDDCRCQDGYHGSECEFVECHGLSTQFAAENLTCSFPAGECVAPETCACRPSFVGDECESLTVNSVSRKDCTQYEANPKDRLVLWSTFVLPVYVKIASVAYECGVEIGESIFSKAVFAIYRSEETSKELSLILGVRLDLTCDRTERRSLLGGPPFLLPPGEYMFGTVNRRSMSFPVPPTAVSTYQVELGLLGALPEKLAFARRDFVERKPIYATFVGSVRLACGGILAGNEEVCSAHGDCRTTDHCSCYPFYSGSDCSNYTCAGMHQNGFGVCSGHGSCVALDDCQCNFGYFGEVCAKGLPLAVIISISATSTALGLVCVAAMIALCIVIGICCSRRKSYGTVSSASSV